ncbi:MAG: phage protease [Phycisphaerales bacterium]|nr:phage protease [Phycisphaerales bacterium]
MLAKTEKIETDVEQIVLEASALDETVVADEQTVPNRILIVPVGHVKSTSGSFLVDEEAISMTVASFKAHGTDLPIDYEHQTLGGPYSSPTGQAPAAGWIKALTQIQAPASVTAEDGTTPEPGLWAEVSWTAEAREKLTHKQYRYISPVALVRKSDRRLVGIHSVALTNKPAIVGMRPVVNRLVTTRVHHTPDNNTSTKSATMLALREALTLDDSTDDRTVLAEAVRHIQVLRRTEAVRQATDRVATAMAAGKLSVCQRDWALSLAERDPAEFDRWAASAPKVVTLGRTSPPGETAADRSTVESTARAEWRSNKNFLEKFCSEDAYAANAVRECRL